jgi:hypothetical protein
MAVFYGKRLQSRYGCIGHSDIRDDTETCGHRGLRYIGADVARRKRLLEPFGAGNCESVSRLRQRYRAC